MKRAFVISVAISLFLLSITSVATSSPEAIMADVDITSQLSVVPNRANQTDIPITGTFYITEKSGIDQPLETDASVSVSGGPWPATVDPSTFQAVEKEIFYEFTVTVMVPQDASPGESGSYTVEVVFSNVMGSSDPETASVRITLESGPQTGDDEPGGNTTAPPAPSSFPYWLVFLGGILILVAVGVIWAVRNLEVVRETSGDRRIMLREKDSGRVYDGRKRD